MLEQRAIDLLEERRLDVELLARLGVASTRDRDGKGGTWIAIPYVRDGKVVHNDYRTLGFDKRFSQDKGGAPCVWNVDCLYDETLTNTRVIITEGVFDAVAAMMAGHQRVISVPGGAPSEPVGLDDRARKYRYLDPILNLLRDQDRVLLATDDDEPGRALREDLALRIGKARCLWVPYPKGCKDLNETLIQWGVRGVTSCFEKAREIRVSGVYRMKDLPPRPKREAYDLGLPGLRHHWKLRLGDLTVVSGIPSHGKTAFTNEVGALAIEKLGWSVGWASFEQEPQTDHRRWLRTRHSGKPEVSMSEEEIDAADAWINQTAVFIHPTDDENLIDLQWVLERVEVAVLRYGLKLVIIDPWNEIDHDCPPDMTMTQYTGFAIKRLKRLAARLNIHLIIVAHPAKLRSDGKGNYGPPSLYDIADSAHWVNKCDVGIIIHRDNPKSAQTRAIFRKVRFHDEIGVPGELPLIYDQGRSKFTVEEDLL